MSSREQHVVIIPCLFGTSGGLEVRPLVTSRFSSIIEDAWIEISPEQAALHSTGNCFRVLRKRVEDDTLTWIGLYRSAFEIGYSRRGGFYGAGLWLINKTADSQIVCSVLRELADQLRDLALSNGQFIKKIADVRDSIDVPRGISSLMSSIGNINGGVAANATKAAFVSTASDPVPILHWAQERPVAELFSSVLAGPEEMCPMQPQSGSFFHVFANLDELTDWAHVQLTQDNLVNLKSSRRLVSLNEKLGLEKRNLEDRLKLSTEQINRAIGSEHRARKELQWYREKNSTNEYQEDYFKFFLIIYFVISVPSIAFVSSYYYYNTYYPEKTENVLIPKEPKNTQETSKTDLSKDQHDRNVEEFVKQRTRSLKRIP